MSTTDKISILGYGQSDCGKSTQVRYIAEYIWKKYQKRTRLIALDRGSLWAPCQDLVDEGIVIPCEFPTDYVYNPFAIMRKFRRGEWPEGDRINAPTSVSDKGTIRYRTNTKWLPWTQKETEEIGFVAVDSLTTFATAFMSDAKQKNLRIGTKQKDDELPPQPREEDGETAGTNTISHYGDAHTELLDAIQAFQALPVPLLYFTALEGKGEDDDTGLKKTVLGPDTVGKAITGKLPSRVSACFHLTSEGTGAKKKVKAWYTKHDSDIPRLQWPAKVPFLPHQLPELWKKWPDGFITLSLDKGIREFLEFRDELLKKGEKDGKTQQPD
jgi:hypothetical protein